MAPLRLLFLADTHLGFDLPVRPRVERRRRGHDFLGNYQLALASALGGHVDLVVHGGDVFDRPDVGPDVAYQAFAPLRRIADRGIPVVIVPGNHERARIPHTHLLAHPGITVFDRPRTAVLTVRGVRVALTGFPYHRRDVRTNFTEVLAATDWSSTDADVQLLCMHHCVEGATVGPGNYTFTTADDVVRHRDIPPAFAAVLSGHIHRHQVLTRDLHGAALATPVLYPGSIERTALAEAGETKGFLQLTITPGVSGPPVHWQFEHLPARPMVRLDVALERYTSTALRDVVAETIRTLPPDAVLVVRASGVGTAEQLRVLSAAALRPLAPATMNVEVRLDGFTGRRERAGAAPEEEWLTLPL